MTLVIFPSEPFDPRTIDPDFAHEREAALSAGFSTALVDHTAVTQGRALQAVARVTPDDGEALYRGWMLTPEQYEAMHEAMRARGVTLATKPQSYKFCHYLPEAYPLLRGQTPRTVWLPLSGQPDFDEICQVAAKLGDGPIVVKDYVKSQKHYWSDACFIRSASDPESVRPVVERFLQLQGAELNVGLVFREYVPLRIVGTHPRSGMPLAAEFRTFWFRGAPILTHKYWADLVSIDVPPPLEGFSQIVRKVRSPLFTMDVALRDDGTWTVVELGDGQVAGLPDSSLAPSFFKALANF